MSRLVVATCLFLGVSFAAERGARADVPPACADGTLTALMYNSGFAQGEHLVSAAWASIASCERVDDFFEIVTDNVSRLTLRSGASEFLTCRYTGTFDGVISALEELYGTCSDQCFLDGTIAGELSAQVYCELSIAFGGLVVIEDFLRGPIEICGLNFEIGCDSTFIAETLDYETVTGDSCEPYTRDPFYDAWDQTRNNQCIFEIPDDDPIPLADADTGEM